MEIKQKILKLLQDMVVPDLGKIREETSKIITTLELTNKRLDDINNHLVDQSRRIDETNKRIDEIHSDLINRIDQTNMRIDEISAKLSSSIDANNARIDRFFETTVTKYEHGKMDERVDRLEREVEAMRRQIVA